MMNSWRLAGQCGGQMGINWMSTSVWLSILLLVVLAATIVVVILKYSHHEVNPYQGALTVLANEYAAGKITDAEYRQRKQNILAKHN